MYRNPVRKNKWKGETMPAFNINQRFASKKSCTTPVYEIPKNTREWLGIDTIRKNGIFKIEPMNGLAISLKMLIISTKILIKRKVHCWN